MYTIIYKPSKSKTAFLTFLSLLLLTLLHQVLKYYFKHYIIVTALIITLCILILVRGIGIFVMYPGTYRYLTAQMEKNQNDFMLHALHGNLGAIEKICGQLRGRGLQYLRANYYGLYGAELVDSAKMHLNLLTKGDRRSQYRMELIDSFKELIEVLESGVASDKDQMQGQGDQRISISKIFTKPTIVLQIKTEQSLFELKQLAGDAIKLCRKIWHLCHKISTIPAHPSPESQPESSQSLKASKSKVATWHLFSQKLFTIDSYFAYWDNFFNYETFMVNVGGGHAIECALIHGEKTEKDIGKLRGKKPCVLFCNPNGVIFQAFALNSTFINFYLKWGCRIFLWNYRGYAKSTGIASVTNCIKDIKQLYLYLTKQLHVNVAVVHGYSIGGAAAINLVQTVNTGSRSPIKLLVADRTFSSIDRVAEGFTSKAQRCRKLLSFISRPIVKFFFMAECINSSKKFLNCNCNKIIIYSPDDEVISSSASLKVGIQEQVLEINEELRDLTARYSFAIARLYKKQKRIYEKVMNILYELDGGGKIIDLQMDPVLQGGKKQFSTQEIVKESLEYFIGFCIYGPKLNIPYFSTLKEQQQFVQKKLELKINLLWQCQRNVPEDTCEVKQWIQSVIQCIEYAKSGLTEENWKEMRRKYGELIVSEVGHNSELKGQYGPLERILKSSINIPEASPQALA